LVNDLFIKKKSLEMLTDSLDLKKSLSKLMIGTRHQWLTPVILANQEAQIRRIVV
jgi:hypothetical protein